MTFSAVQQSERERLALLRMTKMMDAEVLPAFDAITRLLARSLNCPAVALSLVDTHRVWHLSHHGLALREQPRAGSFAESVLARGSARFIGDTLSASDVGALPAGVVPQRLMAAAGTPILVQGQVLGVVCAYDISPRDWGDADRAALQDAASAVAAHIEAETHVIRARKLEARVRTASLAGSDWLWETDATGRLTWVSEGLVQHTGIDPQVEIGRPGMDLYTPRNEEDALAWQRVISLRGVPQPFQNLIGERDTPRGRLIVSVSGIPVFDREGQFRGYRGASSNITRRVKAEENAHRADRLLRQALESFDISVMITDADGQVVFSNAQWRKNLPPSDASDGTHWPTTLRQLLASGAYPDAVGREDDFYAWRMTRHETDESHEIRFGDRWILIRDVMLPDGSVAHFGMDITRRKADAVLLQQQQDSLRDTEARLSAVLSALPDQWFLIDERNRYLAGHTHHPLALEAIENLIGKHLGVELPALVAERVNLVVNAARESRCAQITEYQLPMPDGGTRHFEARVSPMPAGQVLILTRDVSERQMAEERLRMSEALYRSVATSITDGLIIVGMDGRMVALNPAATRSLGMSTEEASQEEWGDHSRVRLLHDDLRSVLPLEQWPIQHTLATGQRVTNRVVPMQRADGEIVWIDVTTNLLRTELSAEPFAVMATFRDITHEREAVQQLAVSEERWKFALEGAGDAVWDCDAETGDAYFSPRCHQMLGYGEEVQWTTRWQFDQLIHPEDRERATHDFMRYVRDENGKGVHQTEFRLAHRDGHYIHILSRGKVMQRDENGAPKRVVGTLADITLHKEAERALRDKQAAQAASAAKSEFLSRMSHEIRTPLNAISGFAQLLHLQLAQPQHAARLTGELNYLDQILHACTHLTGLVNDVLDLQHVEAGLLTTHLAPMPVSEELQQCIHMLTPMARQHGIELHAAPTSGMSVLGDRQRLRQVFMNLGSNAIKYNRPGGSVRFTVEATDDGGVNVTIEDTGLGMDEAQLAKLYQPFERLGKETSNIEGTGLGLIITRSLVQSMGGQIDIESRPGVGTRVHVRLQQAHPDACAGDAPCPPTPSPTASAMAASDCTTPAPGGANVPPLQVLYVEDNRINAMLFEEALRPYPQLVLRIAEDGDAALEMARELTPDVLVLDAHLPGMSGFEVLEALRQLPGLADAPAYMCSADAMPEDVERARHAGFAGYWTKPIDIALVTSALCGLASRGDNVVP